MSVEYETFWNGSMKHVLVCVQPDPDPVEWRVTPLERDEMRRKTPEEIYTVAVETLRTPGTVAEITRATGIPPAQAWNVVQTLLKRRAIRILDRSELQQGYRGRTKYQAVRE